MEPIAIVGMGCRLSGGVTSTHKLWELLSSGRSGQCEVPKSRFNADIFFNENTDHPGSIHAAGGYFIEGDIRLFDNAVFGINNLEATYMDAQQRQLLEVTYECFESAGATVQALSGADIGCYIANFTTDYVTMQAKGPEYYHRYSATGFGPTILANRISHVFNLKGPSVVLDTACSSSLYALNAACAALRLGECRAAVVAGANLIQSPEMYIAMVKAGVLSGTSASHTFDISADGYGRGEAVGALYLKPMRDAIRLNDPIRAVIRGVATNSNGFTPGITLPSIAGQEAVIQKAYAVAGLPTDDTIYIEAHGTGTPRGDPIEVEALSRVLRNKSGQPILIGSVKTNLGHSGAVSGITSVIKVVLALEKRLIPPTIGIRNIHPELKLEERNIRVVTKLSPWPAKATLRAGINSFGYGGANSHVIIEAASVHLGEDYDCEHEAVRRARNYILPFSAQNMKSLKRNVAAMASSGQLPSDLPNLAYVLGCRRSKFSTKGYMVVDVSNFFENFESQLQVLEPSATVRLSPLAFIFTGQGTQYPEMGRQMLDCFISYRQSIRHLDAVLSRLYSPPNWTIEGTVIEPDKTSQIHKASHSQTVCTAVQIALVILLREWGFQPSAVIGHSSGEIAAAFAAGYLTAESAISIAYYRGLAVSELSIKGAMLAVGLGFDDANHLLSGLAMYDKVCIACINSPESTTLSGDVGTIEQIHLILKGQGTFARRLKTDEKAYHSQAMNLIGQRYEHLMSKIPFLNDTEFPNGGAIKMFSTVSKRIVSGLDLRSPQYWRKNLESPVLFHDALTLLLQDDQYDLIEIGPHPTLGQPVRDIQKKVKTASPYFSTLSRHKISELAMLDLVGNLYLHGHSPVFEKVNGLDSGEMTLKPRVLENLPGYAWDYGAPLWNECRVSSEYRNRAYRHHELLGSRIPGGANTTASWKNTLRLGDVTWLQDHKLGPTTVFPAAAYAAMAIEALRQETNRSSFVTIAFKQVHLSNVLILPDDKIGVEVFTAIKPAKLSSVSNSAAWWYFEISSYATSTATIHVNGFVRMTTRDLPIDTKPLLSAESMEEQAIRTWYDKFDREGLCFGPAFRTLTEVSIDRSGKMPVSISKTALRHGSDKRSDRHPDYLLHPVNIDALLQTAIIASASGTVENLRSKVPALIGSLEISAAGLSDSSSHFTIHAASEKVGFGTVMLSAELKNQMGRTLASMRDVRAVAYAERLLSDGSSIERNPALRILWKPDVSEFDTTRVTELTDYIRDFVSFLPDNAAGSRLVRIAGAVDLLVHKNPRMRILELGDGESSQLAAVLDLTGIGPPQKRFESYTKGSFDAKGNLLTSRVYSSHITDPKEAELAPDQADASYDVVIMPSLNESQDLSKILDLLTDYTTLDTSLVYPTRSSDRILSEKQFCVLQTNFGDSEDDVAIGRAQPKRAAFSQSHMANLAMVVADKAHGLNCHIAAKLSEALGFEVPQISIGEELAISVAPGSIVIATIELESPVLANMTQHHMQILKEVTNNSSVLVWITCGALFKAERPLFSLILGLARSLMLERPAMRMPVLDLETTTYDLASSTHHVMSVLHQALYSTNPEYEYRQHNGILYISRFVPDHQINRRFRKAQSGEIELKPLQEAGDCEIAIRNVGQIDTLHFIQRPFSVLKIPEKHLKVQVKAVGLNAKDYYAVSNKIGTKYSTCSLEFTGIVTETSSPTSSFSSGDRIVVMAPCHFATYKWVPEFACCKLQAEEDFATLSTVTLVFSTALYALENRASLQPGETILIHSAAGGLGIAAIQISQLKGAEIFATVGTEEKKRFLIETFNIPEDHIFNSHDSSFLHSVLAATSNRGVDVVLNSLTGDLLQDSWQACAEFGRFVEVGKKDISECGRLDMQVFSRGVTFTAFDLTSLYWSESKSKRQVWQELLNKCLKLLRAGSIKPIKPLKVFRASEVSQAFRYFSLATRIGKVAVSFETETQLPIVPIKFRTKFKLDRAYILVGCLGGLGRSLSRWMFERGARNFVHISRSGTDKIPAESLVHDFKMAGANVTIIRGDVTVLQDVEKAMTASTRPIGGIIHAAMGIHVSLFTDMPRAIWHKGIGQKVQGALNLHTALRGRDSDLDFFLMLSSITGSIGTATESNYCAANAFLDSFASHRQNLGLPATSVGLGMISEVGFLHENPEIEAVLLRKGVHPFTEDEMIQIIDVALTPPPSEPVSKVDHLFGSYHHGQAHILTGLELHGFQNIRNKGFKRATQVLEDRRCAIIAGEFASSGQEKPADGQKISGLPRGIVAAIASNEGSAVPNETLLGATLSIVTEKLGSLLLVPATQLRQDTQLAEYGVESMLAAEFRADMVRIFRVDVPFAVLLDRRTNLQMVAELVATHVLACKSETVT